MRRYFILIVWFFFANIAYSQQGDGGIPTGIKSFSKAGTEIPFYSFEQPDVQALLNEDKINDELGNGPWRYGYVYPTYIDILEVGTRLTKENGEEAVFFKISSEKAQTINLTFSNTEIPTGNKLYVYSPQGDFVLGKFTSNHLYKGELGTELIPGEEVIIEYVISPENFNQPGSVVVSQVTHGYRSLKGFQEKAFGSSGSCHMNVNCPDGLPFKDQRNSSVYILTGSGGVCSGALINNTEFDGKPYVLTANHCYNSNIASWVVRFNWQSDDCANPATEPSYESLSGTELKARRQTSDFCLIEITGGLVNGTVPEYINPYFAGWDNSGDIPTNTYSIHHPVGDIKKISFSDQAPYATQATISGVPSEPNGVWKVTWDRNTSTQGGSSGAPLFDHKGLIIGQLWGGQSGCHNAGTPNAFDFYGRLKNSWEPLGSDSTNQLKYWLDPNNTGTSSIIGFYPHQIPKTLDVSLLYILNIEENTCTSSFSPQVVIMNKGTDNLTTLTIEYTHNGTLNSFNWTGNLAQFETEEVNLPAVNSQMGSNTLSIELLQPNGDIDEDLDDNYRTIEYIANPEGAKVNFKFYMSCWPEENSWELTDDDDNILYSGDNYPLGSNTNFLAEENFCLPNGCYTLTLKDSYGDGVAGAVHSTCDYNGSMILTETMSGVVLAQLSESEANFGHEISFDFCITSADISQHSIDDKIKIYPNPSRGNFTVKMELEGEKTINITTIQGKIISSYQVQGNTLKVQEERLTSGIYLIKINNGKNSTTQKIVVH